MSEPFFTDVPGPIPFGGLDSSDPLAFKVYQPERVVLGNHIAGRAWHTAAAVLNKPDIALEIAVFDRDGGLVGKTDFRPSHEASRPLKRR